MNEAGVASHIRIIIQDVVDAVGLGKFLQVEQEISITVVRPDVFIFYQNQLPVGVCEVKRPTVETTKPDPLDDPNILGQMRTYLDMLVLQGVDQPLGIVTTYNSWRFAWLPTSQASAISKDRIILTAALAQLSQVLNANNRVPDELQQPIDFDHPSFIQAGSPKTESFTNADAEPETIKDEERPICASPIIKWSDKDLCVYIGACILKMVNSPRTSRPFIDPTLPYARLSTALELTSERLPKECHTIRLANLPGPTSIKFFLLHDLGSGRDGRLWLATNSSGALCVLKIRTSTADQTHTVILESAKMEANLWNTIWKDTLPQRHRVFTVSFSKSHQKVAIVMPYITPIKMTQVRNEDARDAVKAAIDHMIENGFKHNDLSEKKAWEHVGLYRKNGALKAVLFDLSDVEGPISESEKLEAARKEMYKSFGISS